MLISSTYMSLRDEKSSYFYFFSINIQFETVKLFIL